MFSVWGKREERVVVVYDIAYDAITGYPQFLIYDDGEWRRVNAKYYEPAESKDTLNIEDLKEKYVSDSRPYRRDKAFEELQKYVADFVYDLHMGNFKEE